MTSRKLPLLLTAALFCTAATPAAAYIGPGLGAGAIATVLGVIGAVFLLIAALVYYPVKRLLKRSKAGPAKSPAADTEAP
ncbi:hypothetical protein KHP62_20130 [Rhodobacteraceae bacterium NNCM2]|nr:hypothetical protein [Coraliihabitans acroporae]